MEEREDQLSVQSEEYDSSYQLSEGSLHDDDTEDESDLLIE